MERIVIKTPTHTHCSLSPSHVFNPAPRGHVLLSSYSRPFMKCFPTSNTFTVTHLPSRPSSFATRTCSGHTRVSHDYHVTPM